MIDDRFIIKLNGKSFVTYEGLLSTGHEIGIESIKVELLQLPNEDNGMLCVARASVVSKDGQEFTDYGDASPESVNSKIVPHIIRMCCTRAKARALRDFTNIGMTAVEELSPDDMEAEPATLSQISLIKKLAKELGIEAETKDLDKTKASNLISELTSKKSTLKIAK